MIYLLVLIIIELAVLNYMTFMLGTYQARIKRELQGQISKHYNEFRMISISQFEELKTKLVEYAKIFEPKPQTEVEHKLAEVKEEREILASIVAGSNPPKCQFCGDVLGKVKRRPDGYWCCTRCSIKQFGTVS